MRNPKELHKEFVALAFDIIKMKNRLMGLLLEIYERGIYKGQGCRTIYEYGFKYARLSKEVIDKALRTLKHLHDKPCLRKAIETEGIHKVAMVATIATPETDKVLASHVENMSKAALFEFSKELRHGHEECMAVAKKVTIELDQEMQVLFLRLKEKYAKDCFNGEALKVMLKKLDSSENSVPGNETVTQKSIPGNVIFHKSSSVKTTDESQESAQLRDAATSEPTNPFELQSPKIPSRYIPVAVKRKIFAKYGEKCAYPNCPNPPHQLHHRVPFSFRRSHDSVMPLCRVHHEFAHNGVIKYELSEPEKWKLGIDGKKNLFDQLRLVYRSG